jgi:hypothetical protein
MELRGTTRVFCRIRPLRVVGGRSPTAASYSAVSLVDEVARNSVLVQLKADSRDGQQRFDFDRVFHPQSTQVRRHAAAVAAR